MSAEFEIWDNTTANLLQFERLDDALDALRDLVRNTGPDAVVGLSLDAVSDRGDERMTLAEGLALLDLIGTTAKPG